MFDSMIQANGVGLAGPQAGISKRLFVVIADDDIRRVFINPQIISTSSNITDYEEGCLSIPGVYEVIKRPEKVTVQAFNEKGKKLISEIKTTNPYIKIITSVGKFLANDFRNMGEPMQNMLYKDMFATDVYTMGYAKDSRTNLDFIHKMSINRNALIFSCY